MDEFKEERAILNDENSLVIRTGKMLSLLDFDLIRRSCDNAVVCATFSSLHDLITMSMRILDYSYANRIGLFSGKHRFNDNAIREARSRYKVISDLLTKKMTRIHINISRIMLRKYIANVDGEMGYITVPFIRMEKGEDYVSFNVYDSDTMSFIAGSILLDMNMTDGIIKHFMVTRRFQVCFIQEPIMSSIDSGLEFVTNDISLPNVESDNNLEFTQFFAFLDHARHYHFIHDLVCAGIGDGCDGMNYVSQCSDDEITVVESIIEVMKALIPNSSSDVLSDMLCNVRLLIDPDSYVKADELMLHNAERVYNTLYHPLQLMSSVRIRD